MNRLDAGVMQEIVSRIAAVTPSTGVNRAEVRAAGSTGTWASAVGNDHGLLLAFESLSKTCGTRHYAGCR